MRHFAVEHQEDGKLGIAGSGFAKEVDGLLNESGGKVRDGRIDGGHKVKGRGVERSRFTCWCEPVVFFPKVQSTRRKAILASLRMLASPSANDTASKMR